MQSLRRDRAICGRVHRRAAGRAYRLAAVAAAALAAVTLRGCASSDTDYFGPNEPTWVRVPTTTDDAVYVGVIVLNAHPGDTVRLDSIKVTRLEGDARVEPIVDVLHGETRLLGGISESAIGETADLDAYQPLSGTVFTEADGPVAFAVRVTGTTPVHGFDGLSIRFTLNDADQVVEDWIPMRASVCTATTLNESVEICEPIRRQMLNETP